MGKEAHRLLDPYVNNVSKNNNYAAMYGPGMKGSDVKWEPIMHDIYTNLLTPLQATAKYPGKIYLNTSISYALDVTEANKPEIFKKVFALVEFLKQKGFGYMKISIGFYPIDSKNGKIITAHSFDTSKPGWTKNLNFSIAIDKNFKNINKWEDVAKYFNKWDYEHKRWNKGN
jgi:hypothetical protein